MQTENEQTILARYPRTLLVLVMLTGAAALVSWLAAYALPGALVAANVLPPWPAGADPRRLWMIESFLGFLAGFIVLSGLLRFLSHRQLRRIDAMAE